MYPSKNTPNYIYELNVKEEVFFLAGQESRECCVFISDVGISGMYLSLIDCTTKFKLD